MADRREYFLSRVIGRYASGSAYLLEFMVCRMTLPRSEEGFCTPCGQGDALAQSALRTRIEFVRRSTDYSKVYS
jgi:hypothetical protein